MLHCPVSSTATENVSRYTRSTCRGFSPYPPRNVHVESFHSTVMRVSPLFCHQTVYFGSLPPRKNVKAERQVRTTGRYTPCTSLSSPRRGGACPWRFAWNSSARARQGRRTWRATRQRLLRTKNGRRCNFCGLDNEPCPQHFSATTNQGAVKKRKYCNIKNGVAKVSPFRSHVGNCPSSLHARSNPHNCNVTANGCHRQERKIRERVAQTSIAVPSPSRTQPN